jgi:poly-gamma-glutamate synthesis protein (capsule biosynthesis protein)
MGPAASDDPWIASAPTIRIFLGGDVMTGRGIDQILPHPASPRLHERYMDSALGYVALAERAHGRIPRPVDFSYVWGDALAEWERARPDARIVNLETSATRSGDYVPKGINYRMSPENAGCLCAAGIDCCTLANNHVLDWGRAGLLETLDVVQRLGLKTCGAGRNIRQASAPAILDVPGKGRVLVLALASPTSGTPLDWAAAADRPGVNVIAELSDSVVDAIAREIGNNRMPGDVVIVSVHWGSNWGYEIPHEQQRFARALIDRADVSVVHGHSTHHAKGIEVYRNRLILYGCGDFLNDYEGITGYAEYRGDLAVMYFANIDPGSGALFGLQLTPLQIENFRLHRASRDDTEWLRDTIERASREFGTRLDRCADNRLKLVLPSA